MPASHINLDMVIKWLIDDYGCKVHSHSYKQTVDTALIIQ